MSAGTRGAVVTTVLSMLFVPVFSHKGVEWKVDQTKVETTVTQCAASQEWQPFHEKTVTGAAPSPPAPWWEVTTMVEGKCVDGHGR